jgi:hypothetical protein
MSCSVTVKLLALLMLVVAYLGLYHFLPPRYTVEPDWEDYGFNWFGQGKAAAYLYAAGIFPLLYLLRYPITAWSRSPADAFAWYLLLVAALLPGVWHLVVFDWENAVVAPVANWIGGPIMFFFVPTALFCCDLGTATRLKPGWFAACALLEVVVLVPLWAVCWACCEFLLLGWVGL